MVNSNDIQIKSLSQNVIRVLAVSPDPGFAEFLRNGLRQSEAVYQIEEFPHIREVMKTISRARTDLILWDCSKPRKDDFDQLVELRASVPAIPVVVVFDETNEFMAMDALKKGVQDCLQKDAWDWRQVSRILRYAVERRRADCQFQMSEHIYRTIFENSAVAIMVADDQGRVISWNKFSENLLGMTAEDLALRSVESLYPEEEWQRLRSLNTRQMGMEHHLETKMRKNTGEMIDIDISITAMKELDGTVSGSIAVIQDITERKKAEQDLKRSNEELRSANLQLIQAEKMESVGRLAAGVAHEVKNPLATIKMGVDFLIKKFAHTDANVHLILNEMNDAVYRANTVVRGLLDFSATKELNLKLVRINSIVDLSLLLVRHDLDSKQIKVIRDFATDIPPFDLDVNKIQQVFINVFLNAIYAMQPEGTLAVRTYFKKLDPKNAVIFADIEDTGTGIPEDKLLRVFDPYFTTKPQGEGTGLGLTVSQKIMELHHGTIKIGNRREGGARVSLIFKMPGAAS